MDRKEEWTSAAVVTIAVDLQQCAAKELSYLLTQRPQFCTMIAAVKCAIPVVMALLSCNEPKTQKHAALIISALSLDIEQRAVILAAGGLPPLSTLLLSACRTTQAAAAETVSRLLLGAEDCLLVRYLIFVYHFCIQNIIHRSIIKLVILRCVTIL